MADTPPIEVHSTPTPAQIEAGFRQAVVALGAIAGTLGYAGVAGKLNVVLAVAGPISALIAFLWGQAITRSKAQEAAAMAAQLPDEIAKLK